MSRCDRVSRVICLDVVTECVWGVDTVQHWNAPLVLLWMYIHGLYNIHILKYLSKEREKVYCAHDLYPRIVERGQWAACISCVIYCLYIPPSWPSSLENYWLIVGLYTFMYMYICVLYSYMYLWCCWWLCCVIDDKRQIYLIFIRFISYYINEYLVSGFQSYCLVYNVN